nr:phosphonoacetaldehyde hydrolase [uncultured Anaeromusa sp.]
MHKVDGVILDWAGTTVDFGCFAPVEAFLQIFKEVGVEATMAEARKPMGLLKRDHIRAMLAMERLQAAWRQVKRRVSTEQDVDSLYERFEPLLLASLEQYAQPLPEVVESVSLLRKAGIRIGSTTGYTDLMMDVVAAGAEKQGYAPDFWITPDSTQSYGRPYPYMIFRNIEALRLTATWTTIKVGDTIADIREGIHAGVWSVGVMVGSSQLGLSYAQYQGLQEKEKSMALAAVAQEFKEAGADFVIPTLGELPTLIEHINGEIAQGKRPYGQ